MAIPKPEPRDWQLANAQELQLTDRQVLQLLRDTQKRVNALLKELERTGKNGVRRAQLERTRALLLSQQATLFERLGDVVSARRAAAAGRSAQLSAAADASLLRLVGQGPQAQFLYEKALDVSQQSIDAALARMRLSALPLAQRIYNTAVWMGGRLSRMINETLAAGLNAREFAKRARDWFNPNTPGGVWYAAMRLARTEINNAFHAISAEKYASTPWVTEVVWNLSKSHPKPDICNTVANGSPYAKDKTPARPHPQCMCYITPEQVDEDEFVENFLDGEYDEYLDAELEKKGWSEEAAAVPTPPTFDERFASAGKEQEALDAVAWGVDRKERPPEFLREWKRNINQYTGTWYRPINRFLRGMGLFQEEDRPIVERIVGEADAAFAAVPGLKREVVAYRGMHSASGIFGEHLKQDLTGFEWIEKAYTSTTALKQRTRVFTANANFDEDQSVILTILIPQGTKAIEGSLLEAEAEIILERDQRLRVVRDNGINPEGKRELDVEVVPQTKRRSVDA